MVILLGRFHIKVGIYESKQIEFVIKTSLVKKKKKKKKKKQFDSNQVVVVRSTLKTGKNRNELHFNLYFIFLLTLNNPTID